MLVVQSGVAWITQDLQNIKRNAPAGSLVTAMLWDYRLLKYIDPQVRLFVKMRLDAFIAACISAWHRSRTVCGSDGGWGELKYLRQLAKGWWASTMASGD